MNFMKREEVERIRSKYPKGTRLKLDHMDDSFALPAGTLGTVRGVDDAGDIMVNWDNGSSLKIILETDRFHVV